MELLEILGYAVGLLVGVIMGLMGGGGALLLPAMLYLLKKQLDLATAYTTLLVGMAALVGFLTRLKSKEYDVPTAVALGLPITVGMLLVRLWLNGAVPDVLFSVGDVAITKKMFVLGLFTIVLLLSFSTMTGLIGKNMKPLTGMRSTRPVRYYSILVVGGLLIGILPGFSGAGGGVLIVPLLIVFFGLPVKTVVGTSLSIVSVKSFVGFFGGDVAKIGGQIEWQFLVGFATTMIAGVLIGAQIARRIEGEKLKTIFAWFILGLAIFIITYEFIIPLFCTPTPVST